MRVIPSILCAAITTGLVLVLNVQLPVGGTKTPRLGAFLSPQKGFWQNAEDTSIKYQLQLASDKLQGKVEVYFDDRLVPHVYASQENDAYFVQGYLHAKFRLWQMEFQTYAAAGRLSEIMGEESGGTNFVKIDKMFRRLGMVYAAERSLEQMEADSTTKSQCDAYTAGVNTYISSLSEEDYPVEYKLLDYKPELWTNLKTALFLKFMSYDLAGFEEDFEHTNARSVFTKQEFEALYPYGGALTDPIIPKGAVYYDPEDRMPIPALADSLYFLYKPAAVAAVPDTTKPAAVPDTTVKPDKANGSNNWALSGSKTLSGRPILCNDPHLGLGLPSLWYEMQISTPRYNAYGVSFPGAPAIIIGFNDQCAFGFTNSSRDVRDYYEIRFKDKSMKEYWYNGGWQRTTFRDEVIKVKGGSDRVEHIAMTVWGPVMYDASYPDPLGTGKAYACKWKAHEPSNELRTFTLLDGAKGYIDYLDALSTYKTPGQNMLFAAKSGDIAIRQQGEFPAKWRRQGDFVMPGDDSTFAWRRDIDAEENLTFFNPSRGFLSSANQYAYDTIYPYYLGGSYEVFRGMIINRYLQSMEQATVADMERMQTDNYNVFAELARPVLLNYLNESMLNADEKKYVDIVRAWNLRNDAREKGPTVFKIWWDSLAVCIYGDELAQSRKPMPWPEKVTLLEGMLQGPAYQFADDITTPDVKESVAEMVMKAYKQVVPVLKETESRQKLEWGTYLDAGVRHLLKLPALSRLHLNSGGGEGIINAMKQHHGPSWRMIVELTDRTNAYGVYPGGQQGNPGSKYYDSFVDTWNTGRYYKLQILDKETIKKYKGLSGIMTFSKS
ncbi:penicillin acylase family protein [Filimonas effusa]|uniref:Penicillin acylase family protein n=1 Tax=Filimonas effusa TaxID=2508721 RepID=A0A4Q1D808_9BACT|nr:penicillin acylase family protein [Filimonas effusa]RXK85444.1 penicillin acylase family protein [Filimonas effusa]